MCDTVGDERNGGKNEDAEMRNFDDEARDVPLSLEKQEQEDDVGRD